MIELIDRLINFQVRYNVDCTFSVFTNEDKTDMFIMILLDKNGYRVSRCIDYKQWLEMSNMEKDFQLTRMIRELYNDTDSIIYSDFNKKQEI